MTRSISGRRAAVCAVCAALSTLSGALLPSPAQAQVPRPVRQPSESPIAPGSSQTSKLPAGVDTGEPGAGQTPSLIDMAPRDKTRRNILRKEAATAAGPPGGIDDSAAAKLAARPRAALPAAAPDAAGNAAGTGPAVAASSPVPSRKRSPPTR